MYTHIQRVREARSDVPDCAREGHLYSYYGDSKWVFLIGFQMDDTAFNADGQVIYVSPES